MSGWRWSAEGPWSSLLLRLLRWGRRSWDGVEVGAGEANVYLPFDDLAYFARLGSFLSEWRQPIVPDSGALGLTPRCWPELQ